MFALLQLLIVKCGLGKNNLSLKKLLFKMCGFWSRYRRFCATIPWMQRSSQCHHPFEKRRGSASFIHCMDKHGKRSGSIFWITWHQYWTQSLRENPCQLPSVANYFDTSTLTFKLAACTRCNRTCNKQCLCHQPSQPVYSMGNEWTSDPGPRP